MMDFFAINFVCVHLETYIVLHIYCLLTSIEPIAPNGSLLHLVLVIELFS